MFSRYKSTVSPTGIYFSLLIVTNTYNDGWCIYATIEGCSGDIRYQDVDVGKWKYMRNRGIKRIREAGVVSSNLAIPTNVWLVFFSSAE